VALAAPFGPLGPPQPRWVPDSGLGAATPSARSAYARSSLGLSLAQRTPTCGSWPWTRWRSGSEAARSTSPCWHSCCSMFPRAISRTPVVRGRLALQAASGPESQYPAIQGDRHCLRAILHVKLGEDVEEVRLDRGFADEQRGSDLLVGPTPGHVFEDLDLACAEHLVAGCALAVHQARRDYGREDRGA